MNSPVSVAPVVSLCARRDCGPWIWRTISVSINWMLPLILGLKDCISCGCCSYICPSNIPLVQYFKYASGEVAARQQAQHKSEQTKRLIDARNARMERIARQQLEEEQARIAAKKERERLKAEQEALA